MRPKKSTVASRTNGAQAKNKGKAKATVPVLTAHVGESTCTIGVVQRAKLPKGYVAYESELHFHHAAIENGQSDGVDQSEEKKTALGWHDGGKELSMQMAADAKDLDVTEKIAKFKALTAGAKTDFVFPSAVEKSAPRRPYRGSGRAARSR